MEDEIRKLLNIIENHGKCDYCGTFLKEDGTCFYCGNKKLEMVPIFNALKDDLKSLPRDYHNPIYQELYHFRKIPFVGKLFNNEEFVAYLKEIIHPINIKVVSFQQLNSAELANYQFLLQEIPAYLSDAAINYAVRSVLLKRQEFSLMEFEKVLTVFIKRLMNNYVDNPIVRIKPADKMNLGQMKCYGLFSYHDQSININKEAIRECYTQPTYNLFITLFHELTHLEQFSRQWQNKKTSMVDSQEIKEQILKDIAPNFYQENYDGLIFESEANANALKMTLKYFKKIKVELSKNVESELLKRYQLNLNNLFKKEYLYQGENRTIDDIFSQVILTKDMRQYLQKYPQLNFELIETGNGYRLKTIQEMIRDYQKLIAKNKNADEKRIINKFYSNKVASRFDLGLNTDFNYHNQR